MEQREAERRERRRQLEEKRLEREAALQKQREEAERLKAEQEAAERLNAIKLRKELEREQEEKRIRAEQVLSLAKEFRTRSLARLGMKGWKAFMDRCRNELKRVEGIQLRFCVRRWLGRLRGRWEERGRIAVDRANKQLYAEFWTAWKQVNLRSAAELQLMLFSSS